MNNDLPARTEGGAVQRWSDLGPSNHAPSRQGTFDGSRFTQFVARHYKLFLAVLLLVMAAGALLTARQQKIYVSKASVLLDQRKQQVVQDQTDVVSSLPSDSSVVDTEVQLLNSPGMAYQVARSLNLVPDDGKVQPGSEEQRRASEVLRRIMLSRTVQRIGLTYVIDISYASPDPQTAQTLASAYAQTYVDSQVDVRVRANTRAREHLEREIAKLQVQVKDADQAVARYKASHGLTDTSVNGTLTEQEISSYNQALAAARAQAAEDAQRLAAARAQLGRGSDTLGDAASPGLIQLRAQESIASAKVADLASRYGPNHPELITARQQLDDVRRLIKAQSNRAISSLQAQAQASSGRADAISSRLSATESALQTAGGAAVELHELQMRLDAPQKLLEAYQARLAQLSTQAGSEQPDARIISPAPLPLVPSSPNWLINMVLATGLGLALGLVAVLVRQMFAVGVASGEDVELSFGVDFLAALPTVKHADDVALVDKVVEEPTSAFAEALRGLAASVLFTGSAAPRVLAVSSSFADEGKTTTSIALGRVIAMRGRRVLIIDCDIQRPSFYQRFGIGGEAGLVDVLQGQATLSDAIIGDHRTPAHYLPLGRGLQPGQTLDEARVGELLDTLRERYDVILLDLPPVLQVAEARVFARLADTVVLLARWKRTSKQAIESALAMLFRANATVSGVALTQVPASSGRALYGYSTPVGRLGSSPA